MGILTSLAQSSLLDYDFDRDTTTVLSGSDAAILGAGLFVFIFIAVALSYVFYAICLMGIFKKASVPAWIAWIPFFNTWKVLEIGGQQGFWSILSIIPFVSIVSAVFVYIAQYHIGKKLGHGGEFILLAIFLPFVWYIWLAVEKSTWNDSASTAPSLHKEAPTPTPTI